MTGPTTLVLDLDGPILDTRRRHEACYRQILAEHGRDPLSSDDYWAAKRAAQLLTKQLAATGSEDLYDAFRARWLDLIETPAMLALDTVQAGAVRQLEQWGAEGRRTVLATLRQNPEALAYELSGFGLDALLDHVLVSSHGDGGEGKAARVRAAVPDLDLERTWWIGDTEADVRGARALGCRVCLVTCGIRNGPFLAALGPDALAADLPDAHRHIAPSPE